MPPMLAVIEASMCAHPSQTGKSLGNVGHVPSRELQVSPEVALPLPLHWEVGCELLRVCLVGVVPTAFQNSSRSFDSQRGIPLLLPFARERAVFYRVRLIP